MSYLPRHGLHLHTLRIDEDRAGIARDAFLNAMTAQNIGVGVPYLSLPEHAYFQQTLSWRPEAYPHALRVGRQAVSRPLSARLADADVDNVIAAVRRCLGRA